MTARHNTQTIVDQNELAPTPRWWRWTCVAMGTLVLCSCQNAHQQEPVSAFATDNPHVQQGEPFAALQGMPPHAAAPQPGLMPPHAMGPHDHAAHGNIIQPGMSAPKMSAPGMPAPGMPAPGMPSGVMPVSYEEPASSGMVRVETTAGLAKDHTLGYPPNPRSPMTPSVPLPQESFGNWSPPGIAQPWPEIEYLRDGGDRASAVAVDSNWNVSGLEMEDTIAHYDTTDGGVHVEPSNRVHLYAPRFAAVRSVTGMSQNDQITRMDNFRADQQLGAMDDMQSAASHLQRDQLAQDIGSRHVEGYALSQYQDIYSRARNAGEFSDKFMPFEDLRIIRQGAFEQTESARLAAGMNAAVTWAHDIQLQVVLDSVLAMQHTRAQSAGEVYTVNSEPGPHKLRVVKVASTNYAKPGEVVDFTIRFDNVGAQVIGNVTIIDNLTTRLEYVEGSAESSLAGEFSTDANEGESLKLRWEINDPLMQGEGGRIRFQCRVR